MPRLRIDGIDYLALPIATRYWMPGDDFVKIISHEIQDIARDGDLIALSEKAISVATGNIIDESEIKPGWLANSLGRLWMPLVWGYLLGRVCHLRSKTIHRLRNYPPIEGARHKELVLRKAGLLQSLRHGSEGGIDGSNLAFSYVALPLEETPKLAKDLCNILSTGLGRAIAVSIINTDMTYSLGRIHFTPRPNPMRGIHSFGGVFAYIIGRMLKLRPRATPLAVAGWDVNTEEALNIAELVHHSRKEGAGKTVWDMADRFNTDLTSVSWDMLKSVKHFPIVIVRKRSIARRP